MKRQHKSKRVTRSKTTSIHRPSTTTTIPTSLASIQHVPRHQHSIQHHTISHRGLTTASPSRGGVNHMATRRSFSMTKASSQPSNISQSEQKTSPIKPQFDYKWIKSNASALGESMVNRKYEPVDVNQVVDLIDQHHNIKHRVQQQRTYRNNIAAQIKSVTTKKPAALSFFDGEGFDSKDLPTLPIKDLVEEGKRMKQVSADLETHLTKLEEDLERMAFKLPNLTHPLSPIGAEENATVLDHVNSTKGNLKHYKEMGYVPQDHLDLARKMDWVDFESAASVTGSRFYYLKNRGAMLELALVNYALSKLVRRGFTPVLPPDLARLPVIEGAGFQSRDEKSLESHVYRVEGSDLTLCGTSEIPLAGMYMNQIIPEAQLPIKMVAYSHCFRQEAGGYGTASRGLYRVHQFSKVEMFVICTPEQSDELHEELINIEKEIFSELGLNFKVLDMPTGDLGAPAYRKVDMEAAMPELILALPSRVLLLDPLLGRAIVIHNAADPTSTLASNPDTLTEIPENYGEISSASNCTDYQSRRLNIRYRPSPSLTSILDQDDLSDTAGGEKLASGPATRFVHTLNGTAVAAPRLIVSIIEQFQNKDGSVTIPQALKPYLFDEQL